MKELWFVKTIKNTELVLCNVAGKEKTVLKENAQYFRDVNGRVMAYIDSEDSSEVPPEPKKRGRPKKSSDI